MTQAAGALPFALYPLRVGLAIVFAYTGLEKLLDVGGNAGIVAYAGLPAPETMTVVIGVLEVAAAMAIFLGIMARTAAAGLSLLLVGVLYTLKLPGTFWGDGWGIDVAVLAGTLTLMINGPGRPTVWSMMGREDPEARWMQRLAGRAPADPTSPNTP